MEVNIRADKNLPFGTEVIVQSDEISKIGYETYVKKHFLFVEDERLVINDNRIKLDKNYQELTSKQGKILFKPEANNIQGSIKIVVANVCIVY